MHAANAGAEKSNNGTCWAQILTSMFMRPGDTILMEEYTYPHMLECVVLPKGGVPVPVPLDGLGIVPAELRQVAGAGLRIVGKESRVGAKQQLPGCMSSSRKSAAALVLGGASWYLAFLVGRSMQTYRMGLIGIPIGMASRGPLAMGLGDLQLAWDGQLSFWKQTGALLCMCNKPTAHACTFC
jgi:hypothetical protein